jgi:hypothetical protein
MVTLSLNSKIFRIGMLPFLVGGLVSCKLLANLGFAFPDQSNALTPIAELKNHQNTGSTVYLQGKVSHQAPFLGSGAYQIQDNTGKIWVITYQQLPQLGKEVLIEGQIEYESIPIDGQEMGELYILEVKQLDSLAQIQPVQPVVKPVVEASPIPTQIIDEPEITPEVPPKPTKKPLDDLLFPHKENRHQ